MSAAHGSASGRLRQGGRGQDFRCVCGHQIAIVYTYNDEENTVQLTAFSDDIVAALEEYDLPGAFDAARGFTEYKGYYFRGYNFQK